MNIKTSEFETFFFYLVNLSFLFLLIIWVIENAAENLINHSLEGELGALL